MDNNIVQIDILKLEYDYKKICQCKNINYEIDVQNRLVRCLSCGAIEDPFEVLLIMAKKFEKVNERIQRGVRQMHELDSYKPFLREAKRYEEMMRKKDMLPICPKCGELFNWHELNSMGNKIFYKKGNEENG